jgi:hypothetical protein
MEEIRAANQLSQARRRWRVAEKDQGLTFFTLSTITDATPETGANVFAHGAEKAA